MKIITTILTFLLTTTNTFANPVACPVCAVVIVSGLSISRFFGVKDCVVGIWLGALLLAISSGLVLLLRKKNINNIFLNILIYVLDYCMLIPLYVGKTPQLIFNAKKILFIDEFLFSVLSGSLVLFGSSKLYYYMKNKNGKPHFPFEKVVLPIANLIVLSIVFSIIML